MGNLRIFISYASEQKKFAGDLQSWLTDLAGIVTFVAHSDIDGGEYWQDSILESIKSCDLFICILSENYRISNYCDQELGIAFALRKKIIPVKHGLNPYGFIHHIHAFSPNIADTHCVEVLFYKIITSLLKSHDRIVADKLVDSLIAKLAKSTSFDMSNKIGMLLIQNIELINIKNRKTIIEASKNNFQVESAYKICDLLEKINTTTN